MISLLPALISLSLTRAQFSPFTGFPSSFTNPGQAEFSNFVDLPSQRQRQPAGLRGPENLSPGCALLLPSGQCISYQDVNTAFGQAAESLPFQPLKFPNIGNFSNEELGNLGTVIHEATRILAKVFIKMFLTGPKSFSYLSLRVTLFPALKAPRFIVHCIMKFLRPMHWNPPQRLTL